MKDIIRAFLKTGTASVFGILSSLITTKIFAIFLGPVGIGLIGILRQILQVFGKITTLTGGPAVIEGIASRESQEERNAFQKSVFVLLIVLYVVVGSVLVLFAPVFASWFFEDPTASQVQLVRLLALPLLFNSLIFYVTKLLNGYRQIGHLALTMIIIAFFNAILAYPVSRLFNAGYDEALILFLITGNIFGSIAGLVFLYRKHERISVFLIRMELLVTQFRRHIRHFLAFALALTIARFSMSGSVAYVQSQLSHQLGLEFVGFFVVAWSFSNRYLELILTSFLTYLLPTLAATRKLKEQVQLTHKVQRLFIILIIPLISGIILFKREIVLLLYSSDFLPALNIIAIFLIGDFLKVSSWSFGIQLLANREAKILMIKDVFISIVFATVAYLSLHNFNTFEGIGVGYILMYVINLIILAFVAIKKYGYFINSEILTPWLIGIGAILSVGIFTWIQNDETGILLKIAVLGGVNFLCWLLIKREEKRRMVNWISQIVKRNN